MTEDTEIVIPSSSSNNVHPTSPANPIINTTTANKEQSSRTTNHNVRTSLVMGVGANVVLLVGYVCNLAFSVYELNGRDRESIAIFFYFFAFALLIVSGLMELGLDLFATRWIGHGRYCDTSAMANKVISILFLLSAILDIVAFIFWMKRDFDTENQLLFVSGYTILLMAFIVIYFQAKELIQQPMNNVIVTTVTGRTDFAANFLVLLATILNVAKVHLDHDDKPNLEDLTDRLEFSVAPFWLLSSLLFVVTDLRLLLEN